MRQKTENICLLDRVLDTALQSQLQYYWDTAANTVTSSMSESVSMKMIKTVYLVHLWSEVTFKTCMSCRFGQLAARKTLTRPIQTGMLQRYAVFPFWTGF